MEAAWYAHGLREYDPKSDIKELAGGLYILPGAQALVELSDKAKDVNYGAALLSQGGLKVAP